MPEFIILLLQIFGAVITIACALAIWGSFVFLLIIEINDRRRISRRAVHRNAPVGHWLKTAYDTRTRLRRQKEADAANSEFFDQIEDFRHDFA